jgi:hypothetical protein
MPKKCIVEPRPYHDGKWRVRVPKALVETHGGCKERYFHSEAQARAFCCQLNNQLCNSTTLAQFAALPPAVQEAALRLALLLHGKRRFTLTVEADDAEEIHD